MIRQISLFIATGAYSGYSPVAPGTAGSLTGLLIYFFLADFSPFVYLSAVVIIIIAGAGAAGAAEAFFKKKDPREVVIDEIAGMLVTLFMVPVSGIHALGGFLLFRIMDIVKPFPGNVEKIRGGWGIMLDDILAGVMANLLLRFAIVYL